MLKSYFGESEWCLYHVFLHRVTSVRGITLCIMCDFCGGRQITHNANFYIMLL